MYLKQTYIEFYLIKTTGGSDYPKRPLQNMKIIVLSTHRSNVFP